MFKQAIVVSCLALTVSYAASIESIVNSALQNNKDLKSIEKSIELASKSIELSTKWKNPTLSIGANDIQFDDPQKRDQEPMQAQYIGFSQVIPVGDKLKIQERIAQKDTTIARYTLEDKKLQFKAKIYEYAYSIAILEKKYELLERFENNIKKQERLLQALYENAKVKQTALINIQIASKNIELNKENLSNTIKNLYLQLERVSYTQINSIDISLDIQPIVLEHNLNKHPKLQIILEKSKKYEDISLLEREKKNSDIKVNMAYFSRDSKYEDYANISVAIPLSVYGTENIKSVQAKIKAQEINDQWMNIKHNFKIQIQSLQNSINSSVKKYALIQEQIIPLKNEMQLSIENYNSLDQIKPQATIKNLNKIITYELKSLDELNRYFSFVSQSIYYTQGNQE